jgi:hypothetical protein
MPVRVTRCVREKAAQNEAQSISCKNEYTPFTVYVKSSPVIFAVYAILTKTPQSKQSPNRRKFAQSGHPDPEQC